MRKALVKKFTLFSSMLCLPLSASVCFAEEKLKSEGVFRLGEVEITGGREESKNLSIDKVYDEEMREFNKDTVNSALNLLPGVTISKLGARNESIVYIRGFDPKHAPLFLDGIPIYVPYDGYPDFGRFYTFDLSEIVVSKGFTSVLYGPNTMGGAINMVLKKPVRKMEGSLGVGYATGDTYKSYINFGTNQDKWYLQLSGSYVDSDYFRLSKDFIPTKTEDGGKRNNSYYQDEKVSIKFAYTPNKDDEYSFNYVYQHGKKGTPPYAGTDPSVQVRYWRWPYWDKESYYYISKTSIDDKNYVKVRLYYDKFKNALFSYDDATYTTITKKYAFKSYYDDYTYGGSIEYGTFFIPKNILKIAAHYKRDYHSEHNEGNPIQHFKVDIYSLGLEDTYNFTKVFYTIFGISYDKQVVRQAEDLKSGKIVDFPKGRTSAFNAQIGLFYKLTDNRKLYFTIGKKSRLPSIKDMYSYRLGTALPNPDLKAEKSINYEIGYEDLLMKKVSIKAAAFYYDIKDYILFATVPDPSNPRKTLNQYQNIGKVIQSGFEISLYTQLLQNLEIGGNYTYLNLDNKTDTQKIINIPKHKLIFYGIYNPIDNLSLLTLVEHNSKRYSSSDGKRIANGFTVVDVKVSYKMYKGLNLEAGINNLFDRNYALDEGYPEPGRNYFVNLIYRF